MIDPIVKAPSPNELIEKINSMTADVNTYNSKIAACEQKVDEFETKIKMQITAVLRTITEGEE